jgi:hypothetical protein
MENKTFLKATYQQKLNELIIRMRESIRKGVQIPPYFFLFDRNNKLHVIDIKESVLMKPGREKIVKEILNNKIDMLSQRGVYINKVLYIREGKFNHRYKEDLDIDLRDDIHRIHGNDSLIITIEDAFDFDLQIYDIIRVEDEGVLYTVISNDPIVDLKTSKLDIEVNINSHYKNLL